MLVLSRKHGESIEFPELNVVVRVIQVRKSRVQLGIEAPREIRVDRSEMVTKVEESEDDANGGNSVIDGDEPERLDQRLLDELAKLEAELAALAELAVSKDRVLARQLASVSIERLVGIRRAVRFASRRDEVKPIAEFMRMRGSLLDKPSPKQPAPKQRAEIDADLPTSTRKEKSQTCPDCVHQSSSGYTIAQPMSQACSVA